jgi:hypothetical protein
MKHSSAIVDTLERMHERLCRIEMAANNGLSESSAKTVYLQAGGRGPTARMDSVEKILAHSIKERVKKWLSNHVSPPRRDCVIEIMDMIRPDLSRVNGTSLRNELVSIFITQRWARAELESYKYVSIIWEALRDLGLLETREISKRLKIPDEINTQIKYYISNGIKKTRQEYIDEIKTIIERGMDGIRPDHRHLMAKDLISGLTEIFKHEDWSRGDRHTHMFVGVIWSALKELDLWITPKLP